MLVDSIALCAISLAPTVLLVLATWLFVPPSEETQAGHFTYTLFYLTLNPLFSLIPANLLAFLVRSNPSDVALIAFFGAIKLFVIGWAFYKSGRRLHPLLATLVAFDLAPAAALGYARTWTGLPTTISSRYQYISLLVFGPRAGIRESLAHNPPDAPFDPSNISTAEARKLIEQFHLH